MIIVEFFCKEKLGPQVGPPVGPLRVSKLTADQLAVECFFQKEKGDDCKVNMDQVQPNFNIISCDITKTKKGKIMVNGFFLKNKKTYRIIEKSTGKLVRSIEADFISQADQDLVDKINQKTPA